MTLTSHEGSLNERRQCVSKKEGEGKASHMIASVMHEGGKYAKSKSLAHFRMGREFSFSSVYHLPAKH